MKVKIFVEGGGDHNEDTITRCRQGFAAYCGKLVGEKSRPKIIPCGSRDQAFKRFKSEIKNGEAEEWFALLVDSEGPVGSKNPVNYLSGRDHWHFPQLDKHQVFLMVQAMEAWLLADREALADFYGNGFLVNSLPGNQDIELIPKTDLEPRLKHASRMAEKKGEYHKTRHGFPLLARIDPAKVERSSMHAKQFHDFLRGPACLDLLRS